MGRKIKFEDFQPVAKVLEKRNYREDTTDTQKHSDSVAPYSDRTTDEIVELLLKIRPGRINYTQEEAAEALDMSYQFINRKCARGKIKTVNYGRIKLITIYELARIFKEGISDVNKKVRQG